MSNYVRNFGVKNYQNQTTILQFIADNMSECFFSETRCTTTLSTLHHITAEAFYTLYTGCILLTNFINK